MLPTVLARLDVCNPKVLKVLLTAASATSITLTLLLDMAQDALKNTPPPPQWVINLNSLPRPKPKSAGTISNPPGYTEASSGKVGPHQIALSVLF